MLPSKGITAYSWFFQKCKIDAIKKKKRLAADVKTLLLIFLWVTNHEQMTYHIYL